MLARVLPDHLLSATNVVSMIFGVIIFVFGVSLRYNFASYLKDFGRDIDDILDSDVCVDPSTKLDFCARWFTSKSIFVGEWAITFGSVVIITGFFIIFISLLGFLSGCRRMPGLLIAMCIGFSGTICLEAYLIHIITSIDSSFHEDAREEMADLLRENYKLTNSQNNSFTRVMNLIMLAGECCGINGRDDFSHNITYVKEDGFVYLFDNPPACCRREILQQEKFKAFTLLHGCQQGMSFVEHTDSIYSQGCYNVMFEYVNITYGVMIYSVLLYLIIWHVIDILLAVLILTQPDIKPASRSDFQASGFRTTLKPLISEYKQYLSVDKSPSVQALTPPSTVIW